MCVGEHGAPAFPGTTGATIAFAKRSGRLLFSDQCVVDTQLFADGDSAKRTDEDPATVQFWLAVWGARMVNPPRAVSAYGAINNVAISQIEEKGVIRL
jgi:hypothetical protein